MVEQQLVDYIKKAKSAGQTDDQTKSLLYKNGWTEQEVRDAFSVINQPSQSQPVAQSQQKPQEPRLQPQPQTASQPRPQPAAQPQQPQYRPSQSNMPGRRRSHLLLNTFIILILIAIIAAGALFIISKISLVKNSAPAENTAADSQTQEEQQAQQPTLASKNVIVVPDDYDSSKISVAAISKSGDKAVYCAPLKASGAVSCFENAEKLDNPYNYKPYWIGFSPNEERVVFLYYDPVKLQSFVFENGQEFTRYNGTITAPNFSQDSQSFIYIVIGRDNKSFVVIDEKPRTSYDKIYGIPTLSSDGKFLIYGARAGQVILYVADRVQE